MRRPMVVLAVAVALAVTVAACDSETAGKPEIATASGASTGASSASTSDAGKSTGSSADPQRPVDQLRLSDMLALIPDQADNQLQPVVVNLYWKAAAAGNVTVPPDGAGRDALIAYQTALTAKVEQQIGMAGSDLPMAFVNNPDTDPGFAFPDIAADVQTFTVPKVALAARGRFDLDAIDTALRGNSAWKDQLTTPTYRDTTIYRWADDLKQDVSKVRTGLFTELGQSRRFSFPDSSTFAYARDDATMHAMLDARGQAVRSLADDDQYAAIAAALDGHDVYSAIVTPPVTLADLMGSLSAKEPAPSSAAVAAMKERLTTYALKPYQRAGIGEALSDGHMQTVLVLANADPAAAQANATAVQKLITSGTSVVTNRSWSDIFTVQSVTAEGTLTVAVLTPTGGKEGGAGNPFAWQHAVWEQDNLLMMAG